MNFSSDAPSVQMGKSPLSEMNQLRGVMLPVEGQDSPEGRDHCSSSLPVPAGDLCFLEAARSETAEEIVIPSSDFSPKNWQESAEDSSRDGRIISSGTGSDRCQQLAEDAKPSLDEERTPNREGKLIITS